jgi:hypothetical protein
MHRNGVYLGNKWKIILSNQINCLPLPTFRDFKSLVFNLNGIKWNQMDCCLVPASSDLSPKQLVF